MGRNFDEIKRIILALQKLMKMASPLQLTGDPVMTLLSPPQAPVAPPERMESQDKDMYCLDWFMCFKREKK